MDADVPEDELGEGDGDVGGLMIGWGQRSASLSMGIRVEGPIEVLES